MPRRTTQDKALPVGLFIILGLVVLVGGVLWLRHFAMRPAYTFYVAYVDPSHIDPGIPVYYRGVQVGRVEAVSLSDDMQYTLLRIGVSHKGLRVREDSRIKIQMEGITGQRFLDIDPPDNENLPPTYVQPNEVVWGHESVTLEKLQEQLARIAEERVLEKILVKADQTLSELTVASQEIKRFSMKANTFFDETRGPTRQAVHQFNRTASAIELATHDFRRYGAQVASAFERFEQEMAYAGDAFESVSQAGQAITETAGIVSSGVQAVQGTFEETATDLQDTTRSIRGTLDETSGELRETNRQVQGQFTPNPANQLREVNLLLDDLEETGRTLEDNLNALEKHSPDPALTPSLQRLKKQAQAIQKLAQSQESVVPPRSTPQQVQARLQAVTTIGESLAATADDLRPQLQGQLMHLRTGSRSYTTTRNLLESVNALGLIGMRLASEASDIEPAAVAGGSRRMGMIPATILQVNETAKRFDCVARQMSDMLDERFLLFKLLFGQPGKDYDCEEFELIRQ